MEPSPSKPDPLEYRAPREDVDQQDLARQAVVAALLTAGFLVAAIAALLFFAVSMDYRGWNVPSGNRGSIIALCGGLALLVSLLIVAYRCHRDIRKRGWAFGIWIGIGVAGLIEGICFVAIS